MNETNYYHKIKVMKPVDAVKWAEENPDIVEGLDENSAAMLRKKLIKQDVEPHIGSKPPETDLPGSKPPADGDQAKPAPEYVGHKLSRFICNKFPNKWILVGNKEIRFKNGEFKTDDPQLIEAICNEPDFGLWILADDPELRKRYRRRR
jgi:hypothetical protein